MPDQETNGWSVYQKLVLDKLDSLHEVQVDFNQKFDSHIKSDQDQFENIRTALAVTAAEKKTSAKWWATIAGGVSFIGSVAFHYLGHH